MVGFALPDVSAALNLAFAQVTRRNSNNAEFYRMGLSRRLAKLGKCIYYGRDFYPYATLDVGSII